MNKKNKKIPKNPIKNDLVKNLLTIILLFVFMASIFTLFDISEEKPREISMNELAAQIKEDRVKEITIKENIVEITLIDEKKEKTLKDPSATLEKILREDYGVSQEKISGTKITTKGKTGMESCFLN